MLRCEFLNFDDPLYVTENDHVRQGLSWSSLAWAFTTRAADFWHPLTWLSHMLDWQLYGWNAWGHHLTNLMLHMANTLLLFAVVRGMTGATGRSAMVAALFGLHPLRVESVAWVAERKDVLSGFFFMLTLWAYARYASSVERQENGGQKPGDRRHGAEARSQRPASVFYLLAVLFFALGLMSKPMLVTLPFVLLLLDYWPLGRLASIGCRVSGMRGLSSLVTRHSSLLLEKVPFFALSVAASVIAFFAQKRGGTVLSLAQLSLAGRLSNAVVSYVRYLGKLVWPSALAVHYPHPGVWPWPQWAGSLVALLVISFFALRLLRAQPWFAIGWFWFVGTLVPVIGLVQVGTHAIADRFSYLPSIGFFLVAVFGLAELAARFGAPRFLLPCGSALVLAGCGLATLRQISFWRDSEALFRHAVEVTPNNAVACNNLGTALQCKGNLDAAIACYREAGRIKPREPMYSENLGHALLEKGQLAEAQAQLDRTLELDPHFALAWFDVGNLRLRLNDNQGAKRAFEQAIAAKKDFPEAHNGLGCLLAAEGKTDEAIARFKTALFYRPQFAYAFNNLGSVLTDQGRAAEAVAQLTRAVQLSPDYADAHYNLANAYAALHRGEQARAEYETALRLKPGHDQAHYKLGNLLLRSGNPAAAASHYRAALQTNPRFAEAHFQIGTLLLGAKETGQAIEHFRKALEAKPDWVEPLNNLAWLLATHAEEKYRDGSEALGLAWQAVQLTHTNDAEALDTLAAAYAELGQFSNAVRTAQQACQLAASAGTNIEAASIAKRLDLYREGRPFRE